MAGLMLLSERDWEVTLVRTFVGAYALIAFCGSFQGNEVFLRDLYGLKKILGRVEKEDMNNHTTAWMLKR
jgi:hypothetical protein